MRIGIDVQTLETNERRRGIGKLCARTIRLLKELAPEHELVLFGRGAQAGEEVAPLLGPRVGYAPIVPPASGAKDDPFSGGHAAPFLWSTPEGRTLDVYHVTSPLMPDILMPVWSPCPVVATLLDAIPAVLRARGTPLFDEEGWRSYEQRVRTLSTYQGFVPISESAADDCAAHLVLPHERMLVTWVPVEQRPLSGIEESQSAEVLRRYRLTPGYVVSVSGYNARKNLDGMMRAFARLPREVQRNHPLVLICALTDAERAELLDLAREHGIGESFHATGYVTDEELAVLVRGAGCMFFPSRYEGFGIPPAEAMACGTPVVAARNSSLPEVLGDSGFLVETDDEQGAADALKQLLTNPDVRAEHAARGFTQVERFAPEHYVEKLLAAYGQAEQGGGVRLPAAGTGTPRSRVAVLAPLTRRVTGVPEPHEEVMARLAVESDVDWFVPEQPRQIPSVDGRLSLYHISTFARRHASYGYQTVLYADGDPENSTFLRSFLEHYPARSMAENDGRFPFVTAQAGATPDSAPETLRRKWLLPADAFVVGYIGELTPEKRLFEILEAFEKFHRAERNSHLLLMGPGDAALLQRMYALCARAALKPVVRFLGQRPDADVQEFLTVADVFVDLKAPGLSRPSSAVASILAAGRPLLVSAVDEFSALPDSVCWKVRPAPDERHDLVGYLQHLLKSPDTGRALGRAAREFMASAEG